MIETTLLVVFISGAALAILVGAVLHVWYAVSLSRVFVKRESQPWRAWVPIMNEAEILRLGRLDPMKATLWLVPVVAVYALVMRAIAAHRLNVEAGRGGGATALAVVLPPVWATMLASATIARPIDAENDDQDAAPIPAFGAPVPPPVFGGPPAPVAAPPVAPAIAAPAAAPVAPPAPAAPAFVPPPAPFIPPAAPAPVERAAPTPEPAPLTRRALRDGSGDAPASGSWQLELPGGARLQLTGTSAVLGRKPSGTEAATQYIAVPDDTRTLSRNHARLDWTAAGWTITDLDSTNGITVDGAPAPANTATPVRSTFTLGDAKLHLHG